jgi:hypothetical protein
VNPAAAFSIHLAALPPDVRKGSAFPDKSWKKSKIRRLHLRFYDKSGIASSIKSKIGKAEPFRTSGGKAAGTRTAITLIIYQSDGCLQFEDTTHEQSRIHDLERQVNHFLDNL